METFLNLLVPYEGVVTPVKYKRRGTVQREASSLYGFCDSHTVCNYLCV